MRVFVAGGTGAIGRYLIPALIEDGHQVTASTSGPSHSWTWPFSRQAASSGSTGLNMIPDPISPDAT